MAKLRLDLDELSVESFDTAARAEEKGTVFGEQCTCYTNCTCPGCPSCDETCADTCGASCLETCVTCDPTCRDYSCWDTCAGQYTCESVTGNQIICMC